MADGVQAMSDVSGLSTDTVHEIWAKVKANHACLDACPNHHFERLPGTDGLRARYRCRNCTGEIDGHAHHWYALGRLHGAASALARVTRT